MSRQEVKFFHCADLLSFDDEKHERLESFTLSLEINIGEVDADSSDIFQIMLLSPDMAIKQPYDKMIVLPILDIASVKMIVDRLVEHCNGLEDPIVGLRKFFDWEYEEYVQGR